MIIIVTVAGVGLDHPLLVHPSLPYVNLPKIWVNCELLTSLAERWHFEHNTFHLPIGEMTVTLEDIWQILHVPVMGSQFEYKAGATMVMEDDR